MESLVVSFVSAVTGVGHSDEDDEKIWIIVPRSHAYLADLLARPFEGREDIEIIVDRRRGDRRTQQRPVPVERRRTNRRRPKEEFVEVVLGRISRSGSPPEGPP